MKRTSYLIAILITLVIGALLQYWLCCSCCETSCQKQDMITEVVVPVVETPEKTPLEGFAIVSEPLQVQHADNFLFMKDSYEIHQPISDALAPLVEQARVHFAENPFKVLEIIGLYSKEEPNPSLFPTIGLARANAVKSYLEKKGFPSQQIKIADRLADADLSQTNAPVWATLFQVSQVSEDALLQEKEKLEAFAAELRKNPIRLYFETGEAHINLNEEERNRVAQLNNYVTQVSDAKVLVVGHTDNVGKRTSNVRLGQERADFVKLYLQKNNFDEAVLEATSQGPDKPIASNKTQEGRAENRRVEITLK